MTFTPKTPLDIGLICGRRPALLERTLASFQSRMLRHMAVAKVTANIDPFMGTDADGNACEALIRAQFPQATILRPDTPGFGRAVKTVWSHGADRHFLHLEDDWVCNTDITPDMLAEAFDHGFDVARLPFSDKRKRDRTPRLRKRKFRVFGVSVYRWWVNDWGTSPRVFAPHLARAYAGLLNPNLDPEKQILNDRNDALYRFQVQHVTKDVWPVGDTALLRDIGREFRDSLSIQKIVHTDGRTEWTG